MTQKIIICGFPHCGTSILKSIIGHIKDVDEIQNETKQINITSNKPFILCKWPFTPQEFFTRKYADYIKIFIIRNPLFVFSSLNKRFNYNIPNNHSFSEYLSTIQSYVKYSDNPQNNIYTIRYEDLFQEQYKNFKNILDCIGLKYENDIFMNKNFTNTIISNNKLPTYIPKNTDHNNYRTWQINQPFVCNNILSKLDLLDSQKQQILNNPLVAKVYPNLHKTFEDGSI